ncbi:MAG: putative toxin-antitoxin system toxin component, PIN family [Thermoanaerobaculia bacterium]
MRAVLDANVLVSGLIRPEGPPGRLLVRFLRDSAFELVASPATLDELRRSLRYPRIRRYLRLPEEEVDLWVEALGAAALVVEGKVSRRVVAADPADDIYIAAATDGLADYIVSGDRHLLDLVEHGGIRIVTPRAFLSLLEP